METWAGTNNLHVPSRPRGHTVHQSQRNLRDIHADSGPMAWWLFMYSTSTTNGNAVHLDHFRLVCHDIPAVYRTTLPGTIMI
jgi:hypothetical protein